MPPMRLARTAVFALACSATAPGCRCNSGSDPAIAAPAASSVAPAGECAPLVSGGPGGWTVQRGAFVQLELPSAWREVPAKGGIEYRESALRRRVFLGEVVFPASSGLGPEQALDRVLNHVRPRLAASELNVKLGPARKLGTPSQPALDFLSVAASRAIYSGMAARRTTDGGVRLVNLTYEEDSPGVSPQCVQRHAAEVIGRVEVLTHPVGTGDGAAIGSLVRFTPAAAAELARQMNPGDSVWIAARPGTRSADYQLELRAPDDLPNDTVRETVDGIRVAVDKPSLTLVDGATVDYSVEGGGFIVSNPNLP